MSLAKDSAGIFQGLADDAPGAEQARAYQIEMFEESMKRNIVVCMDTGSGKTLVAKLRIDAELKRSPGKVVWFLAPSVTLAQQQHSSLTEQLPSYQTRIITSLDNVQYWSKKAIWDAALYNIDIVVSTPQVLLDALTHGFVQLDQLSLLVFDEAHHCNKKAPMNNIMQIFYHPAKQKDAAKVPHVLGLSASPITGTKPGVLEKVESNLDAICRTPTLQFDEYTRYVHEPLVVELAYVATQQPVTTVLTHLRQAIDNLDIEDDPFVHHLRRNGSRKSQADLAILLGTSRTRSVVQLKRLQRNAEDLDSDLGPWACNVFVAECLSGLYGAEILALPTLDGREREYVAKVLSTVRTHLTDPVQTIYHPDLLSAKATVLINFLVEEYTSDIRCIIFVEQRNKAWALSKIISSHPLCQGKYFAAPAVGLSKQDRGFQLVDLVKMKDPSRLLDEFRSGSVNICVSTEVMEEGVDIPACNLVVRFDDSKNFRSFVQSRGRARHAKSKFVILGPKGATYRSWKDLEHEMKAKYADEDRGLAEMDDEAVEELGSDRKFVVQSTG